MEKDFKKLTVYVNRYGLESFALGFDCYSVYEFPTSEKKAKVLILSFLFFNITLTYWYTRDYFPGI